MANFRHDMGQTTLEYAKPSPARRFLRVGMLALCAAGVGIAGKLCYDKFAYPLRLHSHRLSVQSAQANAPGIGLQRPPNAGATPLPDAVRIEEACEALTGSRNSGESFYCGPLEDNPARWITLSINRTESAPISSATLVVRVFEPATLTSAPTLVADPFILPFFTYRKQFQLLAPARSATNPALLILAGTSDGTPFRFELSLSRDAEVRLVEDRTTTAPSPTDQFER